MKPFFALAGLVLAAAAYLALLGALGRIAAWAWGGL